MALFSLFVFVLKIRERRRACFLYNPETFLFEILFKTSITFSPFYFIFLLGIRWPPSWDYQSWALAFKRVV